MVDHRAFLHLLLADTYIAVACGTRPFSLEEVRGICGQLRGPGLAKKHGDRTSLASQAKAREVFDEIRATWLDLYARTPSLLERQVIRERSIMEEANGRVLSELVHGLPGSGSRRRSGNKKSIGLSASVCISDIPRIHSGSASFTFDPELSRIEIHTALGAGTPLQLPVVRLPFPFDRRREHKPVLRLLESSDTVVVLPFRDEAARDTLEDEWQRLIENPAVLNWLPRLHRVIWQRKDASETFTRMWVRDGGDGVRKVDEGQRSVFTGPSSSARLARKLH